MIQATTYKMTNFVLKGNIAYFLMYVHNILTCAFLCIVILNTYIVQLTDPVHNYDTASRTTS